MKNEQVREEKGRELSNVKNRAGSDEQISISMKLTDNTSRPLVVYLRNLP